MLTASEPSTQVLNISLIDPFLFCSSLCALCVLYTHSVSFYFLPIHCLSLYSLSNVLGGEKLVMAFCLSSSFIFIPIADAVHLCQSFCGCCDFVCCVVGSFRLSGYSLPLRESFSSHSTSSPVPVRLSPYIAQYLQGRGTLPSSFIHSPWTLGLSLPSEPEDIFPMTNCLVPIMMLEKEILSCHAQIFSTSFQIQGLCSPAMWECGFSPCICNKAPPHFQLLPCTPALPSEASFPWRP